MTFNLRLGPNRGPTLDFPTPQRFKTKHERENAAPPKKGTVSYTVAFRATHPRESPSGKWSNECPPVLRKQRGGGGGEFTEEAKETTEATGRGHRVRDTKRVCYLQAQIFSEAEEFHQWRSRGSPTRPPQRPHPFRMTCHLCGLSLEAKDSVIGTV